MSGYHLAPPVGYASWEAPAKLDGFPCERAAVRQRTEPPTKLCWNEEDCWDLKRLQNRRRVLVAARYPSSRLRNRSLTSQRGLRLSADLSRIALHSTPPSPEPDAAGNDSVIRAADIRAR
jgi:hypothetical protein